MKKIVGLTGEIACGKSHIAELFCAIGEKEGFPIRHIDVDAIAHDVLDNDMAVRDRVLQYFGTVDRKELGPMVFAESNLMDMLNQFMYPTIFQKCKDMVDSSNCFTIVNSALIVETEIFEKLCDYNLLVVLTPANQQVKNLLARNHSLENSLQRVRSQFSTAEKILAAHEKMKYAGVNKDINYIYNYRENLDEQVETMLYTLEAWK
jgi:dephospho-CoA kinase